MAPNILALDIATKTGWAISVNNIVTSGVWDFSTYKNDMGLLGAMFCDYVDEAIRANVIKSLVIERSIMSGSGDITYRLNGLCFSAHMMGWQHAVPRHEVHPTTLKKFATGSGRAKKKDMIAAVEAWGYHPEDDNEADAIALLIYAMEKLGGGHEVGTT